MSYANQEGIQLDAVDMDTNIDSDKVDSRNIDHGSIQAVWATSSHADATVKLQTSHDGTSWDDLPSGSMTLNAVGAGSKTLQFSLLSFPYIRLSYDKGSNTAGSVTVRSLLKSKK